ncbi:MAG: hypothetical protein D3917_03690, partial [Candidatus Electrothrix sp. AX5]|nr:hypothetical protein [Candidatus Electrothrix sp. AX5]
MNFWGWFLKDYEGGTGGIGALVPKTRADSELIIGDIAWHDDELVDNVDLTLQISYQYHKDDTLFHFLPPG